MNFRRIVHRGLVNYSGDLWYREGLPSDVFRRLVVRKENETPLDRFSGDYEELMTYANFRDLADIIIGNQPLKDRLAVLEPKDGTSLLDRLGELEAMRRTISSGAALEKGDADRLETFVTEFKSAIIRGKKGGGATRRPAERPDSDPPTPPDSGEETLESIFGPEDEPPAKSTVKSRPGRVVVKVSSDGLRKPSRPSPGTTTADDGKDPESGAAGDRDVGSMETPVTDVSARPGPKSDDEGPVAEAEGLERALRDDDNAAILKALHVEVTEIADGMLRRDPKQGHLVWELVGRRGWFEAHREEFELDSLIEFYSLADRFLDADASGAKPGELKAMLAEAGFSKMLLAMREMFLRSRARV